MRRIFIFFLLTLVYGCGPAFDDGTENFFKEWDYESMYRGATNQSRAYTLDMRKKIAIPLLEAIEYGNTIYNNGYQAINTPLLLDNLTINGYPPPENITEYGTCSNAPGTKVYRAGRFSLGTGFFRSPVNYNNFCLSGTGITGSVTVSGSATEDEEFDNSSSGSVRNVYSEMLLDNLSVSVQGNTSASYKLYGVMIRHSSRSRDTIDPTKNVDTPTSVRLGLDMPKGDVVYRFDFYYKSGASNNRYIEFYHPDSGYVTVELSGQSDKLTVDRIDSYTPITMKFYDNETCIFTKEDLSRDKENEYPRWFDCKIKEYDRE